MLTIIVVGVAVAVWLLVIVVLVAAGRAAARGDRQLQEFDGDELAERRRHNAA